MDEILHQLGDLFLGSVPTIILFLLVLFLYRVLVYNPLQKVYAERRARTVGTVENATAAIQSADAKSQEYEARLRAARVEISRQREARMQQWNRERENILQDARHAASERVKEARRSVDNEVASARQALELNADQLASQILQTILPAAAVEGTR